MIRGQFLTFSLNFNQVGRSNLSPILYSVNKNMKKDPRKFNTNFEILVLWIYVLLLSSFDKKKSPLLQEMTIFILTVSLIFVKLLPSHVTAD